MLSISLACLGAFLLGCITNCSVSSSCKPPIIVKDGYLDNPILFSGLSPISMETFPLDGAAQHIIIELNLKSTFSFFTVD